MKQSQKIISVLGVLFVIAVVVLFIYRGSVKDDIAQTQTELSDEQKPDDNAAIVPFSSMFRADGVLYTTLSNEGVDDAVVIPIESECFAVIGLDVYYITEGDSLYAPELRRCGLDGNTDVSITEFASPYGAPVCIGDYIYSAYYTEVDEGMNNGIYRYSIPDGITEKIIDGEYYICGYDASYIYYTLSGESGTNVYRMDYTGADKTAVLNFSTVAENIVISDKYIFFTAFDDLSHCYKIYRSPKSGSGNVDEYAFMCMSGYFDVIDGKLFYEADNSLYSSDINGDNEMKLADLEDGSLYAYGFLKFDNILYFSESTGMSETLWRLNVDTGEKMRQ